jgi:hypothetical protein
MTANVIQDADSTGTLLSSGIVAQDGCRSQVLLPKLHTMTARTWVLVGEYDCDNTASR